jgi:hypothetical protein
MHSPDMDMFWVGSHAKARRKRRVGFATNVRVEVFGRGEFLGWVSREGAKARRKRRVGLGLTQKKREEEVWVGR